MSGRLPATIKSDSTVVGSRNPNEIAWVETHADGSQTLKRRIPKTNLLANRDPFSPIASIDFGKNGELRISVKGMEEAKKAAFQVKGYLNPYTNSVQENLPFHQIEKGCLESSYELDHQTGPLGDFLFLKESWPHRSDGMDVIAVNLSALGLFEGLSSIVMGRAVCFMSHTIGYLRYQWSEMVAVKKRVNPDDQKSLQDWQERSYQISHRLIDPYSRCPESTVFGFRNIYDSVNRGGSSTTEGGGAGQARVLFVRLFA